MTRMKRYWKDANGLSRITFLLLICLLSIQTMGAYRKGTLHSSDHFDIIWDAGNSRISFKIGVTETMHLSATALTMTNASSIINVDSAQVDNVEDQAGTGPPTYPHGQSVTGTIIADAVQADDVSDKAGTGAFGASHGVTAAVDKWFAASGTGGFKGVNYSASDGTAGLSLSDMLGAGTFYGALDVVAALTAGTVASDATVSAVTNVTGDKGYFDDIANEAGSGTPSATYGLTAAVNQDISISGTGAFKGGHIEAADGTVAIDMADATGDLTCKGDIEVATGLACIADVAVTQAESPFTVDTDDYLILVDASGGAVVLTFPVTDGYTYHVKLTAEPGANTVTLQGAAGTVDGAATNVTALVDQYDSVTVVADGANLHLR